MLLIKNCNSYYNYCDQTQKYIIFEHELNEVDEEDTNATINGNIDTGAGSATGNGDTTSNINNGFKYHYHSSTYSTPYLISKEYYNNKPLHTNIMNDLLLLSQQSQHYSLIKHIINNDIQTKYNPPYNHHNHHNNNHVNIEITSMILCTVDSKCRKYLSPSMLISSSSASSTQSSSSSSLSSSHDEL